MFCYNSLKMKHLLIPPYEGKKNLNKAIYVESHFIELNSIFSFFCVRSTFHHIKNIVI